MSVGRSRKFTPYKQSCLKDLVNENIKKCVKVFRKHEDWIDDTYYLFDLTAGDMNSKELTSPLIFLDTLREAELNKDKLLPFKAYFIERDKNTFRKLKYNKRKWISKIEDHNERFYFKKNTKWINRNFIDALEWMISPLRRGKYKWKFGFIYYDPNGIGGYRELDFISKISKYWNALDILLNISPLQLKRCYHSSHPNHKHFDRTLMEIIESINKKYWWIRPPMNNKDRWKWIMLFGTNMKGYQIGRLDFLSVEEIEGEMLLEEYDNFVKTKKEIKQWELVK